LSKKSYKKNEKNFMNYSYVTKHDAIYEFAKENPAENYTIWEFKDLKKIEWKSLWAPFRASHKRTKIWAENNCPELFL
jgi:hypothetical protein